MASGKSRNKNRAAAPQASKQVSAPAVATTAATTAAVTAAPRPEDDTAWHEEYHYVFKDMRHLIMVSVALFVIIIILGFFL